MVSLPEIPAALRELVVTQAYDAYTAEDHAVWRFAVEHTHRRLLQSAHPAYRLGFEAAGISVERIPRVAHMSERLSAIGWSAVCVDGFIPPRAFQEFQAHRILPIAADIRTRGHLTYTPAPDIIHEAAGHAPFLAEPSYAQFLMRIGEVGRRAFTTPADQAIYEAIFTLSEVKEDPSSTPEQLARAEQLLEQAIATQALQGEPSEAALVARLYWWTVEYGLVGELRAPKLYGAGLLSSIGEGYFCEDPSVQKLPLDAACIEVPYDITRPQPQLFVARDFDQLADVLESVASRLSQRRGGVEGARAALASEEVATLVLDRGEPVVGTVLAVHAVEGEGEPVLVVLEQSDGVRALVLGKLSDGREPATLDEPARRRYLDARGVVLRPSDRPIEWLFASAVTSAFAGGGAERMVGSHRASVRVPKPRAASPADQEMQCLFEQARDAFLSLAGAVAAQQVEQIVRRLDAAYPDEWLLRYELLAGLMQAAQRGAAHREPKSATLQAKLTRDLERLEIRYLGREPIATGLSYLRSLTGAPAQPSSEPPEPA